MKVLILITLLISSSFALSHQEQLVLGGKLYKETCISCHGAKGKGNDNVNLIVKSRKLSETILTKEQTYRIIREGAHYWGAKADIMPAFKYVYKDFEIEAISTYISEIFNPNIEKRIKQKCNECEKIKPEQKPKMLKRGKKIYKRNCSWCHGKKGKGDGVATTSPVDSIFPYDLTKTLLTQQQIFLYVKYGGKAWGTHKNDMPSWKKKYDDFTLRSVVKHVDEVLRKGTK
jgi:mono/diheme cytochrome c family protein